MRLICGVLFTVCAVQYVFGQSIQPNLSNVANICETCKCNPELSLMNCMDLSLFKMFNDTEWTVTNSSDKAVTLINIVFDENGIEVVTRFPKMNTRSLSFRHNKIRKIEPRAFYNLTFLEKLDLSDNKLTNQAIQKEVFEGPYDATQYEPLNNLKWLSLANNDIHALNPDVFDHLNHLEVLLLGQNPFKIIDPNTESAISSINTLKVLDMSFMELRKLPEAMFHAPRGALQTLNLTGNLFTILPEALQFATNLVELNMNDNPFEYIGGSNNSFPLLPKLETLYLSNSHTLKIIDDGAFQNLSALQHLYCEGNRHLSSIHPHAFANSKSELSVQWPPIRSIILYNNNLTSINEELLEHWIDLEEIDIRYNPWECACENQWMIDKLIPLIKEKSKNNPAMYEDLKCESPIEMKSKQLSELKGTHMRCEDYYGRRPERDGPILVGIFIGLMIGIPVTLALLYIYRRGCFGIFGYRPSPADYGRAYYKRTELREDLHI